MMSYVCNIWAIWMQVKLPPNIIHSTAKNITSPKVDDNNLPSVVSAIYQTRLLCVMKQLLDLTASKAPKTWNSIIHSNRKH